MAQFLNQRPPIPRLNSASLDREFRNPWSAVNASNDSSGSTLETGPLWLEGGNTVVVLWRHWHNSVSLGTPTVRISDSGGHGWTDSISETMGIAGIRDGYRFGMAFARNTRSGPTSFTMSIADSRTNRSVSAIELKSASGAYVPIATASGTATGGTVTSSALTLARSSVIVGVAGTVNGSNIGDWTGATANGLTASALTTIDPAAVTIVKTSRAELSAATVSASNLNGAIDKLLLVTAFGFVGTFARRERPIIYSLPSSTVPVLSAATAIDIGSTSARPRVTVTFS